MVTVITASTLDGALAALNRTVVQGENKGEKNLVFCEDRLTLLAERSVLSSLGATFDTEVCTFARFLSGGGKTLSKYGSVMKLSALISENGEKLRCFGAGSAQAVYETIAQLSASRITPDLLREGADGTEGSLKNKLYDLALLQEEYEAFLSENGLLDENAYLALLPEKIASSGLSDVNVVFFAFPSFTRQAQEGVRAAIEHANNTTAIFLAGDDECFTNEGVTAFLRVCEEYGDVQKRRYPETAAGEALLLRQCLFSPANYAIGKRPSDKIVLSYRFDEEEELQTVAALIGKHTAEGMRYRDMALLVPDEKSFLAVEKVFSAYRIPFFADKKRAFSSHPFCRFALNVLSGASSGMLPSDADAVASSVYFGNGDEYRNYLMRFASYRGAYRREIKSEETIAPYDRASLCAARERMVGIMSLFPRRSTGERYARSVRDLWDMVAGEEVTEMLSASFEGVEQAFLSVEPLWDLLREIESVSGERTFTAREFADMLKSGMDALEVSMIPVYHDAVFVGDATESKFASAKILFAVGLTEALPRVSADTAIISDGEIARLSELEVRIEPAIAAVNARTREALALNLCSFTERLYLSCPMQADGEEVRPGEVVDTVKNVFDTLPLPELFPYDCRERQPAVLRLAEELAREEDGVYSERYASLRTALERIGEGEYLRRLLGRRREISCGEKLFFTGGCVSPTLLEQYFTCPYMGFAERGLRLAEREEKGFLAVDAGNFVHDVLEISAGKFEELSSEEEVRSFAGQTALSMLASPRYAGLADTKQGVYTCERLADECATVAAALYRQFVGSGFRIGKLEGFITLPEVGLYGKPDRVDEGEGCIRVIDYKTGGIDAAASSYYTGRRLQLQLYLKGASQGKTPAGAFYFPASENFMKEGEIPFRMKGFFNNEERVMQLLDKNWAEQGKSEFFNSGSPQRPSDSGMGEQDFRNFLDYSILVSAKAEREMKEGSIAPSPYKGACAYCKFKGLCGFDGEERFVGAVRCTEIAAVVRRETGEEEE